MDVFIKLLQQKDPKIQWLEEHSFLFPFHIRVPRWEVWVSGGSAPWKCTDSFHLITQILFILTITLPCPPPPPSHPATKPKATFFFCMIEAGLWAHLKSVSILSSCLCSISKNKVICPKTGLEMSSLAGQPMSRFNYISMKAGRTDFWQTSVMEIKPMLV